MPQALCVDDRGGAQRPVVVDREVEGDRLGPADRASGRPRTEPLPSGALTRVERNLMSRRLSTSSSIVLWMLATSSSPSAWIPPVPSMHPERGRRRRSARCSCLGRVLRRPRDSPPRRSTWITRSCPAFAAAPPRFVRTESVAFSGPSRCHARLDRHALSIYRARPTRRKTKRMALELDHPSRHRSRSTRASPRSPTSSASCRASRVAA